MMKIDMGGVGMIFGIVKVIVQLKLDVEVYFISVVIENMFSGYVMYFGDFLIVFNGKIIEVNNIDVEGCLILVDVLVFVEKLGVDVIVDLVIFIGVCVVVLGNDIVGLWSFNDDLVAEIIIVVEKVGEKMWWMFLEEKYFEGLKVMYVDLKNTGFCFGFVIIAVLFLK